MKLTSRSREFTMVKLIFFLIHLVLAQTDSIQEEMQALLDFKRAILSHNPEDGALSTWKSSDRTPCSWQGIECSDNQVSKINLSYQRLGGPIPGRNLVRLRSLDSLVLSANFFNGSIPREISNCTFLRTLDLSNNSLHGEIPRSFSQLSLGTLNISTNNLTGPIPGEIFTNCRQLRLLDLSTNRLHGRIPYQLSSCAGLTTLTFENNELSEEIPRWSLPSLQSLSLANNHLTGPIPRGLFTSSLVTIDLSLNNLTDGIPSSLGSCSKLMNLTLSQNKIVELPTEIGLLSSLEFLVLGRNNLSSLPDTITNCSNLQVLILNENSFTGSIPSSIAKLTRLRYLVLHTNGFEGNIPAWIVENHKQLLHLDLSGNRLTGNIPTGFDGSFRDMKFLLLAGNRFEGSIPESLGEMREIQFLDVSSNRLTGSIPASIGKLQKLLWLMLAGNRLDGPIPRELGNCSSLLWLNAAGNLITGELPTEMHEMGRNVKATFDDNLANFPLIPKEIGECAVLRRWLPSDYPPFSLVNKVLDRDRCQQFWNLLLRGKFMYSVCSATPIEKSMGFIQLSNNRISGSIPESFGNIERISLLFLYQNNLTGSIPGSLSNLKLTGLNLSHNALTGPIPNQFGDFQCLQSLDLSNNNLSGTIPPSLANLTSLNRFNISYNPMLSGPIPFQQQFTTFGEESYYGNYHLCYARTATGSKEPSSNIPFCGETTGKATGDHGRSRRSSIHVSTILGISLSCALGVVVTCLVGICLMNRKPSTSSIADPVDLNLIEYSYSGKLSSRDPSLDHVSVSIFTMDLPKRLTFNDLVKATGNFDKSNVIGCGGFGIVYRALLSDGSTVAIKKLIREGPAAEREFQAEMHTLGHILHENLVPLMGYSSYGAQRLLVYEYMENGSLEDWLYGTPDGNTRDGGLEWPVRLEVAIGTARGLKFLHHSCCPTIIHRDMKASNILLDGQFRPRLTDFGLARALAAQEETHVSTIVAGTLGYVPPEYCQTWRATVKGDVYSFGVVLLELVSGRRPMSDYMNNSNTKENYGSLVEFATECSRQEDFEKLVDPSVARTGSRDDLMKFIKLALDCTQDVPVRRPCMRDVVTRLEDIKDTSPVL